MSHAPQPPRAEFMALLDEHEAIVTETVFQLQTKGHVGADLLDRFRTSRRMVIAAFDRATLSVTAGAESS